MLQVVLTTNRPFPTPGDLDLECETEQNSDNGLQLGGAYVQEAASGRTCSSNKSQGEMHPENFCWGRQGYAERGGVPLDMLVEAERWDFHWKSMANHIHRK